MELEEQRRRFNLSPYAQLLGVEVVELGKGYARATLTVRAEHYGWHGRPHGGLIISLMDEAWGAACNTLDDRLHLAVQLNVHLVGNVEQGQKLEAEARVLHSGETTDMAEITVHNSEGKVIALATGATVALTRSPQR